MFFFNDTATTEIYTLSLHDALPIYRLAEAGWEVLLLEAQPKIGGAVASDRELHPDFVHDRSEEHTSELQSRQYLVCRLLLEKKNKPLLPLAGYSLSECKKGLLAVR